MARLMCCFSIVHSSTTLSLVDPSLLSVRTILLQMTLLVTDMTSHVSHIGLLTPDSSIRNATNFVQIDVSTPPSLGHLF